MKTISFIIPVYNEERRLLKTFTALRELNLPADLKIEEIIFVDDGSTDYTVSILNYLISCIKESSLYLKHNTQYKILNYEANQGKGYAIRQGMLEAKSDYALFFDADMSTPMNELRRFMPQIRQDTDVIIGTRKHKDSKVTIHQSLLRAKLGQGFTAITGFVFGMNLTDYTCGFKAFSRRARQAIFADCRINRWAFDAEILFLAHKYKATIEEVPVAWANDEFTKVKLHRDVILTLVDLSQIIKFHIVNPALSLARGNISLILNSYKGYIIR